MKEYQNMANIKAVTLLLHFTISSCTTKCNTFDAANRMVSRILAYNLT